MLKGWKCQALWAVSESVFLWHKVRLEIKRVKTGYPIS